VCGHLRPDADLLDVACGHGEVALDLAPLCRSVLGYDRIAPWIERAQHTAQERGVANATFVCHDSSPEANGGRARLPAAVGSFDLLICRRGPFHWIEDARRVVRPGAVLLMLAVRQPHLTARQLAPPSAHRALQDGITLEFDDAAQHVADQAPDRRRRVDGGVDHQDGDAGFIEGVPYLQDVLEAAG
jgi:SAM-dependent methyltransferase